ncbi:hypothetical protein ACFFTM_14920 [Pseudoduganella plicata]|uniref:Uncharacterized protein n=1 Tax=Pseudoduganella plicata TaxID=321984 RepID=A0A4P7B8L5_9BURK|nr:hypothetical protein [Pseudoduganella plicata]QBQ34806.1 hypothetical protein E1742_00340 [Pseudoduganella plicata]GGY88669.1 hypothetical protein GCM10007388_22620 [Pseudoduganella plicata]
MRLQAAWAAPALFALSVHGALAAAPAKPPAEKAELPLRYGVNDVTAGDDKFQIMRGLVSNLSATSFDTYTVFLVPSKADAPWMHVTMPATKGMGYNLRSAETGDATMVAIAFFRQQGQLYAVEAERDGNTPAERLKKGSVQFRVYGFNGDGDVPMFEPVETRRSVAKYQNADEALKDEFFIAAGGRYRPAR